MGRSPCCCKEGLNRGAWTALEDKILTAYIKAHGEGKWRNLPKRAGLKRCGKSCRLRWLNYLRPDIKRGNISHDEEELIIRLHKLLGNRWSLIAGRLPGRTDNEIKNYWNTTLGKKADAQSSLPTKSNRSNPPSKSKTKKLSDIEHKNNADQSTSTLQATQVIRTKATRCTKVLVDPPLQFSPPPPPPLPPPPEINTSNSTSVDPSAQTSLLNQNAQVSNSSKFRCGTQELHSNQPSDLKDFHGNGFQAGDHEDPQMAEFDYKKDFPMVPHDALCFEGDWATNMCLEENANLDLESLQFLLDSEDWP